MLLHFLLKIAGIATKRRTATLRHNFSASNKGAHRKGKQTTRGKKGLWMDLPPLQEQSESEQTITGVLTGALTGQISFHINSQRCLCPSYYLKHLLIWGSVGIYDLVSVYLFMWHTASTFTGILVQAEIIFQDHFCVRVRRKRKIFFSLSPSLISSPSLPI